jgi:molybdate transport system substrate-binding protein
MTRKFLAIAVLATGLSLPVCADAAEVTAFISNALKSTMAEHVVVLEKASGVTLKPVFGTTEPLRARIEKGERVDFALLGEEAIEDLVKKGKLIGETRMNIARAGLGVAIRRGSPKLDLSTTEAFKRAMLNAKSISYNERGLTGDYLKTLFARLGISDAVKAKHKNGRGAALVSTGESEIGITQVSEILIEPGVDIAGQLPPEIQNYSVFPAAVATDADEPAIARQIIRHLIRTDAAKVIQSKGLEPATEWRPERP